MRRGCGRPARAVSAVGFVLAGMLAATGSAAQPSEAASTPIIVSPAPGSTTASTTTEISLLGVAARHVTRITVTGSSSGRHGGTFRSYVSEPGKSFIAFAPFDAGETVTVRVGAPIVGSPSGIFHFTIGRRISIGTPSSAPARHTDVSGVEHYLSAPSLDPPTVSVPTGSGIGGDILLTPKGSHGNVGPMIVDSTGQTVWFDPLADEQAFDLNEQTYRGQPVLTLFEGHVVAGHGAGEDLILNRSYQTIATISDDNGYQPDLHEFQLEPDGAAFITSYQDLRWNMTSDGGIADGAAWDGIVQEIDVATGLVMFEWHSLDHVPVSRSDLTASKTPGAALDYFHVNSIQLLAGGDLLVSARNSSAIYEIAPAAEGAVVWQLGGKDSSFAMPADATFWFQHDAREIAPDTITLFDDEASPRRLPQSRAMTITIDPASHRASLQHLVQPPAPLLAVALGNVQTLPGGDEFIEWGTAPYMTENTPSGAIRFEAELPLGDDTYRAYLVDWSADPRTKPSLVLQAPAAGSIVGAVSWNGATAVAFWRVLGGASRSALQQLERMRKQGFEARFSVPTADRVVEVQALSASGKVLATSSVVNAP